MSNPGMHNMYEAYRDMYTAIGVKDVNRILPPPQPPQPMDPAAENIMAMTGKPFQAFKGQDHRAHITSHLNFMATNMAKNSPPVMAALQKNIFEHISLMAQEQLEVEFREEIQQLMQLQQMAQMNPAMAQSPEIQQQLLTLNLSIEARKAKLISEMTQEFKDEENKIMGDFGNDPVARLKARELDLRAMDNEQKRTQAEERLNLDKSRAMMNQDLQEEKLDQNEELAKLRANTSIEKTILGKTLPSSDQMPGNVAIIRKTGE
jgi:signal transduction histidine kinase